MRAYFVRRVHKLSLPLSIELSAEYSALSGGLLEGWSRHKGDTLDRAKWQRCGGIAELRGGATPRIDGFEERVWRKEAVGGTTFGRGRR